MGRSKRSTSAKRAAASKRRRQLRSKRQLCAGKGLIFDVKSKHCRSPHRRGRPRTRPFGPKNRRGRPRIHTTSKRRCNSGMTYNLKRRSCIPDRRTRIGRKIVASELLARI